MRRENVTSFLKICFGEGIKKKNPHRQTTVWDYPRDRGINADGRRLDFGWQTQYIIQMMSYRTAHLKPV